MKPAGVLLMSRALHAGGTERQLTKTAVALDRSKFTPHVGCFRVHGDDAFYRSELEAAGVPVVEFPVQSLFSPWSILAGGSAIRRYIRHHGIRIVHTFDVPANIFGVPAARFARTDLVLSSQRAHRGLLAARGTLMLRITDRLANGIVVNCRAIETHLIQHYGVPREKIHLCYNGIDASAFQPEPRQYMDMLRGADVVIGVVCVLRPEKNLPVLVEAFARMKTHAPGAKLAIVGDGSMRAALEAQACSLGVGADCVFAGRAHNVADWLRSIDIFVLPSTSEALSNSLMEAMACGCAPVASDVGGNPELVEHGVNGLLFPPANVDELAKCLGDLAVNREMRRRFADASERIVKGRFSLDAAARRMGDIYASLLR